MNLNDFADWASAIELRRSVTDDPEKHLGYLGLGLAGEAGETVEVIKKHIRDGGLDRDALHHELGDVMFFWTCICRAMDFDMEDIMETARHRIDAKIAASKS